MSFLNKLFGSNTNSESQPSNPENNNFANSLESFISNLLSADSYIARNDYNSFINENKTEIDYLKKLHNDRLLENYCKQNKLNFSRVQKSINDISAINDLVAEHNRDFINRKMVSEKDYLDNILKEVDPVIQLDEDQRKVVLTDEDYCLVIAGAGAGKTTTVAAKVKYLVEKQNIKPEEILVVSFTNKAVEELKEKIQKQLHIDCPITTFHASGNAILHKQNDEKLNIVQNDKLYFILEDYFNESVLTNENMFDSWS